MIASQISCIQYQIVPDLMMPIGVVKSIHCLAGRPVTERANPSDAIAIHFAYPAKEQRFEKAASHGMGLQTARETSGLHSQEQLIR